MYTLVELEGKDGIQIECGGRLVCRLKGGLWLTIAATHANLKAIDPCRAADFLHGIVLTMSHCAMTGAVPVAMV